MAEKKETNTYHHGNAFQRNNGVMLLVQSGSFEEVGSTIYFPLASW